MGLAKISVQRMGFEPKFETSLGDWIRGMWQNCASFVYLAVSERAALPSFGMQVLL